LNLVMVPSMSIMTALTFKRESSGGSGND